MPQATCTKGCLKSSGCRIRPLKTSEYQPRLTPIGTNEKCTLVWSSVVMVHIKTNEVYGVETPLPRSFFGGVCKFLSLLLRKYSFYRKLILGITLQIHIFFRLRPKNQNWSQTTFTYVFYVLYTHCLLRCPWLFHRRAALFR